MRTRGWNLKWARSIAPALGVAALGIGACAPPADEGAREPRPAVEPEVASAVEPAAENEPTALDLGQVVEWTIAPGETQELLVTAEAGEFLELRIEQLGMDVALGLIGPGGQTLLENDLPIADLGPESLMIVADRPGTYRIRVRAWEGQDPHGGYTARLVALRPAQPADRLRSRAAESFYRGELELWEGRFRAAIDHYERARRLSSDAGDALGQALALDQAGFAWRQLDDLAAAMESYEGAATLYTGLDELRLAVVNANSRAELYLQMGELEHAVESHRAALAYRRQSGDESGEAMTLVSLGRIFKVQGEFQLALDSLERAMALFAPEDRVPLATALYELGTVYERLGKPDEAAERYRAAERLYAEAGRTGLQAYALSRLGQLRFEAGEPQLALRLLGASLELSRQKGGETPSQIVTLRRIGLVLMAQGELDAARQRYVEALELAAGLERPRLQAELFSDLGALSNRLGRGEEALEHHRKARAIFEAVGDRARRAAALLAEAGSLRQIGRPREALVPAAEALEISETLRLKPLSEELRLSFFTTAQPFFDFKIDLLMELERLEPGAGYAATALQVSERARARSLLDLLAEAGAEIRDAAAPDLLAQEAELQSRLNRSVAVMEAEGASERQRARAAAEVERAVSRLDSIRAAIRRQSPRYAELTQPRPLGLGRIQELLDPDTALLEYRLGSERSFLWVVTRDALEAFELGPRAEIEAAARRAHEQLMRPGRGNQGASGKLLCALSRKLLEPAAAHLGGKRLAVVADGALEYLPFAALPDPGFEGSCTDAEPLVVAHEIVNLPSASSLAVLRREAESRVPPAGTIAVLADPVFGAEDPRLTAVLAGAAAAAADDGARVAALRDGGSDARPLRRLPHTGREAMAILALVPAERSYGALGFEASKETVLSGRLAGYRLVHFATHGEFDAERPALSRIHLSRFDRRGEGVEGALRAHEIYNLRLPADLVVLSGCETALGKEVRGEGLLGLARGFMYAGASRVMVSLWKVSDRGTAELMEAFYENLLREGLTPAAAFREAQLSVRATKPQPFFWAGFVLQGDWR